MKKTQSVWITLATIAASIFSLTATGASTKSEKDPFIDEIAKDKYFLSDQCEKYLSNISVLQKIALVQKTEIVSIQDLIYFLEDQQSMLDDFEIELIKHEIKPSKKVMETKEFLKGFANQHSFFNSPPYAHDDASKAVDAIFTIRNNYKIDSEERNNINKYYRCTVISGAFGDGKISSYIEKYKTYVEKRPEEATIGHFYVTAKEARYGATVGTGNQFSEPKQWEGSRFFIVHASFKNLDTESRLPFEGSLFINYNGKDYEFDSTESIHLEGYNIWFKQINPLITMKTKIVYRIPNEIHGEVFWRPGRNVNDTRLWLGFIEAKK